MKRVALCLALAACGPGAPRDVRAPVANTPAVDGTRTRPKLTLDGALAMMPAETEMVFELDVARLRQSVLWERLEPWLRQQGGEVLAEVARECDFDPLETLDTFLMGARGIGGNLELTLFVRGYPQDGASACLERASAASRERGETRSVRVQGDRVLLLEGDVVSLAFEFVDARTLLVVSQAGMFGDEPRLDAALQRRSAGGLTRAAPLHGVLARVDTGATIWLALSGQASVLGAMPYTVGAVRVELHTSADPARAIVGALVIEVGDAGNATSMAQMFKMAIDTLKGGPYDDLAHGLRVSDERGDVTIEVRLELAQLERLVGILGPIFP